VTRFKIKIEWVMPGMEFENWNGLVPH